MSPFNTGVEALKDGKPVAVNLNQPRFAAELLHYLLTVRLEPNAKGILEYLDGTEILRALGYQFEYRF